MSGLEAVVAARERPWRAVPCGRGSPSGRRGRNGTRTSDADPERVPRPFRPAQPRTPAGGRRRRGGTAARGARRAGVRRARRERPGGGSCTRSWRSVEAADLSDRAVLAADMDAIKLAQAIPVRPAGPRPAARRGRSAAVRRVLLDECIDCLVRIVQQLPQYLPRVATEILGRVSSVEDQDRRPRAAGLRGARPSPGSLARRARLAPRTTSEFERRYLEHLSRTLDEVELFGVRVENYRPRATLSVAYVSLSVSTEGRDRHRAPDRMRFADLTEMTAHREATTQRVESAPRPVPAVLAAGARPGRGRARCCGGCR